MAAKSWQCINACVLAKLIEKKLLQVVWVRLLPPSLSVWVPTNLIAMSNTHWIRGCLNFSLIRSILICVEEVPALKITIQSLVFSIQSILIWPWQKENYFNLFLLLCLLLYYFVNCF